MSLLARFRAVRATLAERLERLLEGRDPDADGRWLRAFRRRLAQWRMPRAVSTPMVLQMEALECGAAALAIVLAHFGRWVPLEQLRMECGVSRDGSRASNILKAARRHGLIARGVKCEPDQLRKLEPPLILHWNFNHFLVLDGFRGGDKVRINDPAGGPRTITEEELDHAFTGVALRFEPGPDFVPSGDAPQLLPALARRLRGLETAVLFILIAGLALVIPGLVTPIFPKVFVDQILLRDVDSWMRPMLLTMGLTALAFGAFTWLQQLYLLRLETKMAVSSSARFFWHVLRMPMEFFAQRLTGDIASRVEANDRVAQLLSRDVATNVIGVALIVFYAILMYQYDPLLTFAGVTIVSLNGAALRFVARRRIEASRNLLQEEGKLAGTALGGLQVIETLKAQGGEGDLFNRWAGYQTKVVNIRQRLERYTQVLDAVPPFLAAVTTALILGLGSLRVIEGVLTLGSLVAFQALMLGFATPVQNMVSLGGKLQSIEGDMNRLDDVLRYPVDPSLTHESMAGEARDTRSGEAGTATTKLTGRLQIRGLTFGYSPLAPPLIEDFDLELAPGDRVALVGGSGSGKSTIAKLVGGLYEPWAGEILFDGTPRRDVPRPVMTASVGSVDQSVSLFEGTVRENLTLWDSTVPLADVVAAARDAQIHEDVAARPGGYDSDMAEDGTNWSGGQRQRLEIARALVGQPTLLLLDEATSALDSTTEQQIDDALRRRGCTCLIVAHRLSTIRDADEIIVLEGGRVVQRGRHDDLIRQDGAYATLIASH